MHDDIGVDHTSAVPLTRRPEDRVRLVAPPFQPILGHGMADGVLRPASIGLVEHVEPSVQSQDARCADPLLFQIAFRLNLPGLAPFHQVP